MSQLIMLDLLYERAIRGTGCLAYNVYIGDYVEI